MFFINECNVSGIIYFTLCLFAPIKKSIYSHISNDTISSKSLQRAIQAYSSELMLSVDAAKFYGVPQSTVRNHKSRSPMSIGSDRPYLFKKNDEEYLVQPLLDLERTGFRLAKNKVMKISQDYVETLKQPRKLIFTKY